MPEIILLLHNIRSTHNVGALLRTAEGFGVKKVIFSGYTPYPTLPGDTRLPHIREKLSAAIRKTALKAEDSLVLSYENEPPFAMLKDNGFTIVGLEQDGRSVPLPDYSPPQKLALLVGEEVEGIHPHHRDKCDDLIEIPMFGTKESFNVSVAAGIALYHVATSRQPHPHPTASPDHQ